ncbi:MAG: phospho-N-acetylmuramoyl-pentapeptide- transferase [Candidatus Westeberhardia cardiocondylae]|nr:phospho-N-acetylmuramoyl-pentapeptide- transferase [Candidatus Westeberhardia cardiocondylae]
MFDYFIEYLLTKHNIQINYLTLLQLQTIASLLTSFIISLYIGSIIIKKLKKLKITQIIRKHGPKSHLKKQGTPTMGGIIILLSIIISILIWTNPSNTHVLCILLTLSGYAIIGFIDDYKKIKHKNTHGLSGIRKYLLQSIITCAIIYNILYISKNSEKIMLLPIIQKSIVIPQNNIWLYIIMMYIIIVGASNAVNLTDGLDGLTTMPAILVACGLSIVAWISSHKNIELFNAYIPYLVHANNIMVICTAIIGAGLGFLWFNIYPAKIFMGDVGSLPIGATLGTISILLHQEIFFIIISGIFIIETISIILQIGYFKCTNKKIFLMSPIHHHYELKGSPETHIVIRFWIISFIFILIGLISL